MLPTRKVFSAHNRLVVTAGLVALFIAITTPSFAQTPGLVAAYGFNEGSGTTLTDSSGNNLNGTIVGATWVSTGKYGKALSFNGSTSYVDLGNPAQLRLTGSMTVEAWINAAANPADDGQIVAKSNDAAGWQVKTSPDTGPHTFGVGVSGTSNSRTQRYSTTVRALNTWYHVAAVYDATAGTLSLYVNGVLNNGTLSGTVPASQFDQAVNVNIGRRTGGYYFNGLIDEVRIYNRALSQSEVQTDMNTPVPAPAGPDTTPPTVSITAPADGATVAGTTTLSATASDNVGVAGVQFLLDGANLGAEVTSPPYNLQWNSATASLGPHTLSAKARDLAGNTAFSTSVSITVAPPGPPQIGQWSSVMNWPIVAVHASLLPSGDVLAWSDFTASGGAQLWHPGTNTFTDASYSTTNLFCSGHSFLADGRLFVAGGIVGLVDDVGPRDTETFDSNSNTWTAGGFAVTGRYYPTNTTLPDGRVLIQGGTTTCTSCIADVPEIYNPVTGTSSLMAATTSQPSFKYYPHSFVLPDGRVLVTGQDDRANITQALDLNTQTWTTIDNRILDGHSAAMYLPGKVIKAGTATADDPGHPSAATTYVLDMTQASPSWQSTAPMAFPRSFLNLTILPDGQVLATGGGTTTDPANFSTAVYEAELWSPSSKTWTTMARMQTPRLYHSIALLLPDARVLVAGGGRQTARQQPDPADQANAEIYSPPYLFKGPRPTITSAPALLQYATSFSVLTPDASRIGSVSLIALGAVTHAFNQNQRFVPLTFQVKSDGTGLDVTAPADGRIAPPGPYMLFLVDNTGVPSVAAMTRLPLAGGDAQPPTAPGSLSATAAGSTVNLTWSAATDNVGVTGYNIHRSTTSGFAPSAANKIAQVASTSYSDTSFSSSGTYFYLVTAQDAAGNVGPPSNQSSASVVVDTTPPAVSITAPAGGASVSGTVTVTANATDNVAIAGVQFLLDGANLGAEQTGAGPNYSVSWNTTGTVNGAHTLTARARDGAGNTVTSSPVSVTVVNAGGNGLVAAYSFDEGTGTTVSDRSGNNITGTIVGATWVTTGKYGKALSFNGSSSYVDLGNPTALQLTGSMTLEAWINAAANPADDGQIIAKSNDAAGWQFKTTPDTGPQTFGIGVSASATSRTQRYSAGPRSLNTWYHVAGVYDATAGTLNIYVNGTLSNGSLVGTIPASQFNQSVNVNIGRRTGGFYFNGLIDEIRIYNRALSPAEIQNDMNTPLGTGAPPNDTTPPTVSITAPANGATVSGATSVTASASDNVAVASVQFKLDNNNLGNPVTTAPYTISWDTTTTTAGPHTLTAVATDTSNNSATSAPVSVTVGSGTAATMGQWSNVTNWPLVSVHANLLPNGQVLMWDGQGLGFNTYVWDPGSGGFNFFSSPNNIFCGGNTILADGRMLVVGGHVNAHIGLDVSQIFNSANNTWTVGPSMANPRWYPTATPLPDGRVIVISGESNCDGCFVKTPEIYDPVANNWTPLNGANNWAPPYYPHDFVLPDGRLFVSSTTEAPIAAWVLDIGQQKWSLVDSSHNYDGGSAAMYLPGKIIKMGTSANPDLSTRPSAATAYVIDMNQPTPAWRQIANMAFARTYHTSTVLPDGTVLVTGGGTTTNAIDLSTAVLAAELWDPNTEAWTTLASMHTPRLYHSIALLLPDARVLVSGGGRFNGNSDPTDQPSSEIYSPPYLFKGTRPTITSAPAQLNYGQAFTVQTPDAATIAKVSLIRLGAITHDFNESQVYVPLNFTAGSSSLTVTAPANANLATPGPYMLFLVNTNGVPSVAAMTKLPVPSGDTQAPTAPTNLAITAAPGSASLTWTASSDNVGVTGYNVYRSTTSGFTPGPGNRIGQSATTSYTDTSFTAAGTYFYKVTAVDAAANESAPSNQASVTIALDTTPPQVSITSPANGATVTGTINLVANATDNVAMNRVQFLLDGNPLGSPVTGAGPTYTFSWDSSGTSNGPHTISATAFDGANNQATATNVNVTVSNVSGLVAAYAFNEGTGTTVTDLSGNNITGTIVGATWTNTGKYGKALTFNGASAYVDLGNPTALQLTGSMTVEAWVNAAANPADDGQIVAKSNGTAGWQFKTSPDTGPHTFGIGVSPTSTTITQRYSNTARVLNTWYHVAGVYDAAAGTLNIYVNGVLDSGVILGTVPGSQFNQAVNVNIGRRTGGFYFNGTIDEVRIYNRALTAAQIQQDMNTPLGGTPIAATPAFSPGGGTYTSAQSVTISDTTPGATIYYTTDGSTPTTSSAVYSSPISVATTTTIQAIAAAPNFQNSAVASATYTIQQPTAATPTFSPAGGTYSTVQSVTISDSTAGATIYYTTDGSTPTTSSTVYSGPITVNTSKTLKAIAAAPGLLNSAVGSATYTLVTATPVFSPAAGTYTTAQSVTISDATPGATIYYTTNGTTPTTSSTVYTGPITVSTTTTVQAIAAAAGFANSAVGSATYTIGSTPIAFSQVNAATPSSAQSTVSVAFPAAQVAGDLNVVVVGWNDTTSVVNSVTDSRGNVYQLAIGPTTRTTTLSQSIYYASGIAAGANTVTVTFNKAATAVDVRIAEYRGVTTLDAKAGASGNGSSANSGAATTTAANELIVGAATVANSTKSAGSGFTARIITSPNSDLLEDRVVTATGSYSATATLSGGGWVMQMVTFKP